LKKLVAVLSVAAFFCACASSGGRSRDAGAAANNGNYWVSHPRASELVILGVSAKQSSRDAEIQIAREDAARKASMYHGVWADVKSVLSIGTSYLDYYVDSEKNVVYDEQLEKYIARLKFDKERDVFRDKSGAVFIQFTYPAAFPGNINYKSGKSQNGSPEWITRPPQEIGGFKTGVGKSGKLDRLGDTVRKSYEDAAASIVSYYFTSVRTQDTNVGGQSE
jgi:hypothetical protein